MRRILISAALTLALAGCRFGSAPGTTTTPPSPTNAAVQLDEYAHQACAKLASAVDKRSGGDPTGANLDEFDAVTAARQSVAPGLQPLAAGDGSATADRLRAWCYANGAG